MNSESEICIYVSYLLICCMSIFLRGFSSHLSATESVSLVAFNFKV